MRALSLFTSIFLFLACQPNNSGSSLADKATAEKVKTGMFIPEKASAVSTGYAENVPDEVSASDLAEKLQFNVKVGNGQELYVVPTFDGDQILVLKQGEGRPIPIGGVTRAGKAFYLSAHVSSLKGGGGLVGNTYFTLSALSEPLKGTVSADGNKTNMSVVYEVLNSSGRPEDYLVSYLNQLDTLGPKPIRLIKIGNSIVESKTGETVLEFRELGNQVWRVYGIFADKYFKHGSVVWSPDMKKFYSMRAKGSEIVAWEKQDDNSMDIVAVSTASIKPPKIAIDLLNDNAITSDVKKLALTGPIPYTSARRATSLHLRSVKVAKNGLNLASADPEVAPAESEGESYDRFFDPEFEFAKDSLALSGVSQYSGSNQYPLGAQVDLGGGVVGRVVSPTSRQTTPGGWFTREQTTNITYVQTPSGAVRELKSTNGGTVEQRMLNQYDIRNLQAVTQATLNSPDQARREEEFRQSLRDANKANQSVIQSADAFGEKYGTAQGIVSNVVIPVATANLGTVANNKVQATWQAGGSPTNAVITGQVAEAGVGMVGTTAQFVAGGAKDPGGAAAGIVDATGNVVGAGLAPKSGYVGAVSTLVGAAAGEAANAGQGGFDASNSAIGVGTAVLGTVANSSVPGAGVVVQVAGDGAQVGANYLQATAAENRVGQASAGYYQPQQENQQYTDVLQNAGFQ